MVKKPPNLLLPSKDFSKILKVKRIMIRVRPGVTYSEAAATKISTSRNFGQFQVQYVATNVHRAMNKIKISNEIEVKFIII